MIKEVNLDYTNKTFNTAWNGQSPVENCKMKQEAEIFYRIKNSEQGRTRKNSEQGRHK